MSADFVVEEADLAPSTARDILWVEGWVMLRWDEGSSVEGSMLHWELPMVN